LPLARIVTLENSLKPGAPPEAIGTAPVAVPIGVVHLPGQVFRLRKDGVEVGTSVPYATAHHFGVPDKLPQRRLWPPVGKWPAHWWLELAKQLRAGVTEIVLHLLQNKS